MNLIQSLTDNYGVVSIVVLVWLSIYFILVFWIFIYRYISLSNLISNEKACLDSLVSGKYTLPRNSVFHYNISKIEKKVTEPILQYCLNKTVKEATSGLTFLAVVASTAPFIGLFGTVVEILEAFSTLGNEARVTLDVIAPVISKALVATATGILTAVPAYTFNLFLKRKVFELNTYLKLQIDILLSPKESLKNVDEIV
ncbi:MotA/TolQ/ExbB proton channel family protein [Helicobacter ibis]|uniref:MotA/TolQ/ExbB proton channel family protein n=1 Tax=Helicobacter ibis TaxID=2962633 RepID=A0ABT4VEQ7_9HELI|nr:MotA/TolQ/ExbB proton channel family protein [Helicobacter ibis]MDA3968620.1 MotA/TolQ/ExbB proton channel family protein [Helicobacter ibis]